MPYPNPNLLPGVALPGPPRTFTGQLLDSLAPWNDPQSHWTIYNQAVGAMFEQVFGIVADQSDPTAPDYVPGWSTLLDPDNCPAQFLPYLAMFVGVVVPAGTSDPDARALIKAEAGFQRGTLASIVTAVKRNLLGTKQVVVIERQAASGATDAYHFIVIVKPSEVTTVQQIKDAILTVKPAGLQFDLVVTDAWTWNQATGQFQADTMTWDQTATVRP